MANKRNQFPISNFSNDLGKQLEKTYDQMDLMILSIYEEAKKVQEEYWSKVKGITKEIYDQNKLSIVKRSGDDLSAMTFVVYAPIIKLDSNGNSHSLGMYWGKAKYGHKTKNGNGDKKVQRKSDHVSMRKAPSPYMPGRYESSQFKFNDYNIWQREIVLSIETKLAELRTLIFKLNLSYSDLKTVLEDIDIASKKNDPVEHSTLTTEAELLGELRQALHKFDMDPNRLTREQGQLLMNTPDSVLLNFDINPEIRDTYFG
ncbi:hypothetical protein F0267_01100 [Vibrio coralliilyticus]|uniref:Uncharacterized protein n=1 Tax=Vibrio coralliilyticus TaxID=190893 RepID=A0AAN0W0B8_9VIBR|nr:conjugative transfer protein MobI(A/C) [Vibrio coralliilyticus]AIW22713.1 hypothetical protein IX92_27065 [Vibrio coralliilyticus]NOH36819.1 hypothetical protein [Vibrio coralliilyticus]